MDIKKYIETGILEIYVMGMATAEEKREVEKYAAEFPEIKLELQSIENALSSYALQYNTIPPAGLKEKISKEIFNAEKNKTRKITDITKPHKILPVRKYYSLAASVLLLLLSVAGNFILLKKLSNVRQELAVLNNEKTILAQQLQVQQSDYIMAEKEMQILKQPFNKVVAMQGIPAVSPSSLVTVFWNQATKEVFLHINSLPAPPEGKQYQLWALADGKPIDAGIFEADNSAGLQKLKSIEKAQAFAVTLESQGGSPTPTLSAMYVMGNI